MTEMLPAQQLEAASLEQVLIGGDLSKLNTTDRMMYYKAVCESVGLNPLTKPFEYITLNGKLTLYARRDATDQLRQLHKVSIEIVAREVVEDCYVVTARATTPIRQDESIGAVNIAGLKGDVRANAMMKAETKAKRRVTLSICGLGMLDETEVETIPGAHSARAGAVEALTREEIMRADEVALNMKEWITQGSVGDAVYEMENAALNAEQQIYVWDHFDSKQRSAMKKEQARMKAAAQNRPAATIEQRSGSVADGVDSARSESQAVPSTGDVKASSILAGPADIISPAAHKRLEARISELKLDREAVKSYMMMTFGRAHFTELTKDEYRVIDGFVELTGSVDLNELATAWNALSKDDKKLLIAAKESRKTDFKLAQPATEEEGGP